jgi:hypothetical protein
MGLLLEARDTIANIRKMPSSPNDPEPFKDARAKMEELDTSLETRIPALTIVVQGAAEGETPTIVVDGAQLPAAVTGLPRRVNAGRHTIVVRTPTTQGEQTVDVKEGEQKEVQVTVSAGARTPDTTPPDGETSQTQPEHPSEPSGPTSHSPTALTFVGIGVGGAGLIAGTIRPPVDVEDLGAQGRVPRQPLHVGAQRAQRLQLGELARDHLGRRVHRRGRGRRARRHDADPRPRNVGRVRVARLPGSVTLPRHAAGRWSGLARLPVAAAGHPVDRVRVGGSLWSLLSAQASKSICANVNGRAPASA